MKLLTSFSIRHWEGEIINFVLYWKRWTFLIPTNLICLKFYWIDGSWNELHCKAVHSFSKGPYVEFYNFCKSLQIPLDLIPSGDELAHIRLPAAEPEKKDTQVGTMKSALKRTLIYETVKIMCEWRPLRKVWSCLPIINMFYEWFALLFIITNEKLTSNCSTNITSACM